jgi:hypothetical protein
MAEFIFNNNSTPNYSNPPISSVLDTLRAEDPKKVIDFFLSADFTVLDTACCGSGQFGADGCDFSAPLCPNRDNHLFWDDYHPSNAATTD